MPTPAATEAAHPPALPAWRLAALAMAFAAIPLLWLYGGSPERARERLARALYLAPLATLLFAAAAAAWRFGARTVPLGERLRMWWPGALLALVATAVVAVAVPGRQRVQFDETSMLATSQNMHAQGLAVVTIAALPAQGQILPVATMVDKRPTLFACLASLLHDIRGQALANVFWLNSALLALALFTAFAALRGRAGPRVALAAPLLLLAVPLTVIVASSGGFELLATLLLGWMLLAAHDVTVAPSPRHAAPRLANLAGTGALFAWSRYESLPALLLVGAMVAWRLRDRWPLGAAVRFFFAMLPMLLLPLVPLLVYAQDPRFYPETGGGPLLAIAHLADHVGPFLAAWFWPLLGQPLPGLVAWLAVVALGMHWARHWRTRDATGCPTGDRCCSAAQHTLLFLLPVAAVTTLVLSWFYGDVREPTAQRLFLPAAWATALLPLVVGLRTGHRSALALLLCAAGLAVSQVRSVARDEACPPVPDTALLEALDEAAHRLGPDRGHTLWVGMPAQFLITRGHAAMSPLAFVERAAEIRTLQHQGDLRTVYVIETLRDEAMAPVFGQSRNLLEQLPNEIVLQLGGNRPMAIHRLLP